MDKLAMVSSGIKLAERFCDANNLPMPTVTRVPRADWRFPSTCAYYRKHVITICIERCSAIGTAGRQWSYPGHVTDRTPYGVIAHELGHHVDYMLSDARGAYGGDYSEQMRARVGEPKLTSYCPNDWEWFAEMCRLFITNPDLLRLHRPKTYAAISRDLQPAVLRPWRKVLEHAPERTRQAAARKAGEL